MTYEAAQDYFRKRVMGHDKDPAVMAAQTLTALSVLNNLNDILCQPPLNVPDDMTEDEFRHWITIEVGRCEDRIRQKLYPDT